jgi:hypothetical protein
MSLKYKDFVGKNQQKFEELLRNEARLFEYPTTCSVQSDLVNQGLVNKKEIEDLYHLAVSFKNAKNQDHVRNFAKAVTDINRDLITALISVQRDGELLSEKYEVSLSVSFVVSRTK